MCVCVRACALEGLSRGAERARAATRFCCRLQERQRQQQQQHAQAPARRRRLAARVLSCLEERLMACARRRRRCSMRRHSKLPPMPVADAQRSHDAEARPAAGERGGAHHAGSHTGLDAAQASHQAAAHVPASDTGKPPPPPPPAANERPPPPPPPEAAGADGGESPEEITDTCVADFFQREHGAEEGGARGRQDQVTSPLCPMLVVWAAAVCWAAGCWRALLSYPCWRRLDRRQRHGGTCGGCRGGVGGTGLVGDTGAAWVGAGRPTTTAWRVRWRATSWRGTMQWCDACATPTGPSTSAKPCTGSGTGRDASCTAKRTRRVGSSTRDRCGPGSGTATARCSGRTGPTTWASGSATDPPASASRLIPTAPTTRFVCVCVCVCVCERARACVGVGLEAYPNAPHHQGTFENDQRDGIGVYEFPDGLYYSGGWRRGKRYGSGIATGAPPRPRDTRHARHAT